MHAHRPARRAPAVVVGLDCITGLQSARILARHGVPVVGVATDPSHFACRTRAVERVIAAPTGSTELISALETLGPSLSDRAVLYPCTDASVLLVGRHRERLTPWYHVALSDIGVLETLMDKTRFATFAERVGVRIPRTRLLRERADAARAAWELTFPCVLKPAVKTPRWQQHTTAKVIRVKTPRELLHVYDECAAWTDVLSVQEWVEGPESELYSCNCYYDREGRPAVTFIARKLRQWPPRTGTSCLGEECRNDVVLAQALRLFDAAGYRGLGYLEVKRDVRTNEHFAIEANVGRPTGRSAIAENGGVELLYGMYCDTLGLPMPNCTQRYVGAKWLFLRQDLRSAAYYWRRGELTLRDWARSLRGVRSDAVLSWSDPGPFVADLIGAAVPGRRRPDRSASSTAASPAS